MTTKQVMNTPRKTVQKSLKHACLHGGEIMFLGKSSYGNNCFIPSLCTICSDSFHIWPIANVLLDSSCDVQKAKYSNVKYESTVGLKHTMQMISKLCFGWETETDLVSF